MFSQKCVSDIIQNIALVNLLIVKMLGEILPHAIALHLYACSLYLLLSSLVLSGP